MELNGIAARKEDDSWDKMSPIHKNRVLKLEKYYQEGLEQIIKSLEQDQRLNKNASNE